MSNLIGIDFGTSNCTMTQWDGIPKVLALGADRPAAWNFPHFEQLVPSVFGQRAEERLFGWEAKQLTTGNLQAVKRLLSGSTHMDLGGRTYSCRHVAALLFANLKHAAGEAGVDVSSAVVTIPANSAGKARFRTRQAAKMAGIQVKALINEPTAAAMAYLADHPDVESLLVYDWGGGTIDATLIEHRDGIYRELASRGIAGLGGIEVDKRLRELVFASLPEAATYTGEQAAGFALELERTKIRLSATEDLDEEIPFVSPDGRHEIALTRRAFEAAIGFLIEKTLDPVKRCLEDAQTEALDLDAVLMVGGSSQIPRVRERLTEFLSTVDEGRPEYNVLDPDQRVEPVPAANFEPMSAVSRGASIAAAAMEGATEVAFKVIAGHSLGTRTKLSDGRSGFSEVIRRGSALPARAVNAYTPNADYEKKLAIQIWEGDPLLPLEDDENVLLADLSLVIDPPRKREESIFLLEYRYDLDGILHIKATDKKTGRVLLQGNDYFEDSTDIDPEIRDVDGTFAPYEEAAPSTAKVQSPRPVARPRTASSVSAVRRPVAAVAAPVSTSIRTMVVDGSNIACLGRDVARGGERPSYVQLQSALVALATTFPDDRVIVVVDANLRHKLSDEEKVLFEADLARRSVLMPPAGLVGAGDALILAIADETGAIVVSNDSFREWQVQYPWIRQGRVLGATAAADAWFFLPRTPPQPRVDAPARLARTEASVRPAAASQELRTPLSGSLPEGWQNSHWWSGE